MTTGRQQPQRETRTQAVLTQLRKDGLPADTQIFTWNASYGQYVWNVSQALAVVQASPRPAHPVHPPLMRSTLATARVDQAAVAKADPSRPGLVAVYYDLAERYWQSVIIDGNHRAVRAQQTGYPFACYALTITESWLLLQHAPHGWESVYYAQHLLEDRDSLHHASPPAPAAPYVRTRRPVFRAPTRPGRLTGGAGGRRR